MRAAALESFLAHLRLIASRLTTANGDGKQEPGLANWPEVVVRDESYFKFSTNATTLPCAAHVPTRYPTT